MASIAFTRNYITQEQLGKAYRRLGHTPKPAAEWSATLLIGESLSLSWACPVLLADPEEYESSENDQLPTWTGWHVMATAGELDWPPLRPETEIWPALLDRHPVPTGEQAEFQARKLGGSVEDMHRSSLRSHYLTDAHLDTAGRIKRNQSDINFDPLVRDWDVTARELAEFLDTHQPPKLTTEQRVMAQGARLRLLEAQVEQTKTSLAQLIRNAAHDQGTSLRHGFKADMARWSGKTRPTVDAWLADPGCCEGPVPGSDAQESTTLA
ncbi:hypothetical protein [Nocardia nova]|uniref:hypothetical protein n=1 Tax=Nocardia nova TaxID=37330 RepID=UPI0033E23761